MSDSSDTSHSSNDCVRSFSASSSKILILSSVGALLECSKSTQDLSMDAMPSLDSMAFPFAEDDGTLSTTAVGLPNGNCPLAGSMADGSPSD